MIIVVAVTKLKLKLCGDEEDNITSQQQQQ